MRVHPVHPLAVVVVVVLIAPLAVMPGAAEGDATVSIQPLGPDTGRFWFHVADGVFCEIAARDATFGQSSRPLLYATNTEADPCAADSDASAARAMTSSVAVQTVRFALGVDQTVELEEGAPIRATVWVWTESAGGVWPSFTFSAGSGPGRIVRIVDAAPTDALVPVPLDSVEPGSTAWTRFDVDLGLAPASFPSGPVYLNVDISNDAEGIRRLGLVRAGLGWSGAHTSYLDLPLAVQVDEPDPPVEDPVLPWPPGIENATVRPGVQHVTNGAQCTINFVFQDRTTEKVYMGTAAHCVDGVPIGGTSSRNPTSSIAKVVVSRSSRRPRVIVFVTGSTRET